MSAGITLALFESDRRTQVQPSQTYSAMSEKAAQAVKAQLKSKPASNLGLPAGRTPTGCYQLLTSWSEAGGIDWQQATCFGLDEYLDVSQPGSFRHYLEENLYKGTNLPAENRHNPFFIDDYDARIAAAGGLDLTLLGIGKNGHIAFNEPGTPLESWTHSIWLAESTRKANADLFKQSEQIPTRAVTMGIRTILSSAKILLLASGKEKQSILDKALNGPITADVPASFLQLHNNLTVFTDFEPG
jgi:glucosamine-6-phosphate deaminase